MDFFEEFLLSVKNKTCYGYGLRRIPDPFDDIVMGVVKVVCQADTSKASSMLSQMGPVHGSMLIAFATRMATEIVREDNATLARLGLNACAIAARLTDWRDALRPVSLLHNGLSKVGRLEDFDLGMNNLPKDEFDNILREYPNRPNQNRSIEAMGYHEGSDQDGFRYISKF